TTRRPAGRPWAGGSRAPPRSRRRWGATRRRFPGTGGRTRGGTCSWKSPAGANAQASGEVSGAARPARRAGGSTPANPGPDGGRHAPIWDSPAMVDPRPHVLRTLETLLAAFVVVMMSNALIGPVLDPTQAGGDTNPVLRLAWLPAYAAIGLLALVRLPRL